VFPTSWNGLQYVNILDFHQGIYTNLMHCDHLGMKMSRNIWSLDFLLLMLLTLPLVHSSSDTNSKLLTSCTASS
jgi:hypothetical protein